MRGYVTGPDYDALASLPDIAYERWLEERDAADRAAWNNEVAYHRRIALIEAAVAEAFRERAL